AYRPVVFYRGPEPTSFIVEWGTKFCAFHQTRSEVVNEQVVLVKIERTISFGRAMTVSNMWQGISSFTGVSSNKEDSEISKLVHSKAIQEVKDHGNLRINPISVAVDLKRKWKTIVTQVARMQTEQCALSFRLETVRGRKKLACEESSGIDAFSSESTIWWNSSSNFWLVGSSSSISFLKLWPGPNCIVVGGFQGSQCGPQTFFPWLRQNDSWIPELKSIRFFPAGSPVLDGFSPSYTFGSPSLNFDFAFALLSNPLRALNCSVNVVV
ncbi:hypothetical protein OSTOST_25718, partial [Ostertagia ostertagi]